MYLAIQTFMGLLESLIIFFSFGAAFGTHHFLDQKPRTGKGLLMSAAAVLIWPIYLIALLVRKSRPSSTNKAFAFFGELDSHSDEKLLQTQKALESLLKPALDSGSLFSWRSIVSRYSGLCLALMEPTARRKHEIINVAHKRPAETQHLCLSRRNFLKLTQHRNQARADFVSTLENLLVKLPTSDPAIAAAIDFIVLLNDPEGIDSVLRISDKDVQIRRTNTVDIVGNTKWITQKRQQKRESAVM